jgi:hypothetical protein
MSYADYRQGRFLVAETIQLTVCSAFLVDPCDGNVFDIPDIRTGALGVKTDVAYQVVSILSLSRV